MSPKSMGKMLEEIGVEHDNKLKEWKSNIDNYFLNIITQKNRLETLQSQKAILEQDQQAKMMEYDVNIKECEKNLEKARLERPSSYSIVLDNFDIMVHSAEMMSDNQNKDYHWCNHSAVLDRVNPIEESDFKPKQSLEDTPNITFVPSLEEQFDILNDLVIIVARVLVEHFKAFEPFKKVVPKHIKHKYWEEMKRKSEKVNLGIIFKDENVGEEMVDIVRDLHKWVPSKEDEIYDRVPIIGDQKTIERGVESQFSLRNAYTKIRRLEGCIFQLADWHHENKFLALIFDRFYSGASAGDLSSLFALRNQINWRDVVSDAEKKPAQCKRFLHLVLDGQIIAAAMEFFGMKTVKDEPSNNIIPDEIKEATTTAKQEFLQELIKKFLSVFVINENLYKTQRENVAALDKWEICQRSQTLTVDGKYPCRYPGCQASYVYDGASRRRHEMSHTPPPTILEEPILASAQNENEGVEDICDDVYNYQCSLMNMALLLRNFNDATKEGDGPRIIRCIKVFLLHYKEDGSGSTKYALEALYQLFQLYALLTPREAERLTWNRSVNNKGGAGHNVPSDLDLEHDNHLFKEMCRGLGANLPCTSVTRISNAFFACKELIKKLDDEINMRSTSGEHTKKDINQDLYKIVRSFTEQKVFVQQPGRTMKSFPNCPRDYLERLDSKSFFTWITEHKKKVAQEKRPR